MNVLVACEFSGVVRDAFVRAGHNAVSCDILPSERPNGSHHEGNVLEILYSLRWDLLIAHPPCTYLANSGARWLYRSKGVKDEDRWKKMDAACKFFNKLLKAPIRERCIENPIPHKHAAMRIGPYSQLIQPWQFGHGETKATCLWLRNLPYLKPTNIVSGREPRVHHASPGPDRWKERSRTLEGIAEAMAEQWT